MRREKPALNEALAISIKEIVAVIGQHRDPCISRRRNKSGARIFGWPCRIFEDIKADPQSLLIGFAIGHRPLREEHLSERDNAVDHPRPAPF